MAEKFTPIQQTERYEIIDVLRGLAIFGILMVNMPLMFEPVMQLIMGAKQDVPVHHIISESIIKFFFEGKFYILFSMLFGFGFYIFLNKGEGSTESIIPLYRRRLFFLILFGIAHITFFWAGDILMFYAIFGFSLILFKQSSDRKIMIWAIILLLIPSVGTALITGFLWLLSQVPDVSPLLDETFEEAGNKMKEQMASLTAIYGSGSFPEMMSARWEEYRTLLPGIIFFYPLVMAMFLIGLLIGRRRYLVDYMDHLPLFRKVFWWGLFTGIIANAIYAYAFRQMSFVPDKWSLITTLMHTVGGLTLGMCYVSALVLLFAKGKAGKLIELLAPVGRMALTNYLMHSIITAILFHAYGFGLYGKIELWQGILLSIIIFTVQIFYSRWWLKRFYFGPFEWLWRSLTYLKRQPMRRTINIHSDK